MRNITHDEVCDNSLNAARAVNKMVRSAGNEKRVENSCGETKKARHLYGSVTYLLLTYSMVQSPS